jgi:hypothetical protein
MAHLLEFDSLLGRLPEEVSVDGETLSVGTQRLRAFSIPEPEKLSWRELGIDVVGALNGLRSFLRATGCEDDPGAALARWAPDAGLIYFHLLLRGLEQRAPRSGSQGADRRRARSP